MKRRDLVRHLEAAGCVLLREGASHTLYVNPLTKAKEAIPRHSEVKKHLARKICRGLSAPEPPGA
jgi:predicted RNA binding protein YcfA (HicA-like mRNA interferase family)